MGEGCGCYEKSKVSELEASDRAWGETLRFNE